MTEFNFAAAIAARPKGDTAGQLIAAYGNPLAGSREDPRTKGWFIPNPQWEVENMTSILTADLPGFPPFGSQHVEKIKLHKAVAPVFRATWEELVRRGLHDKLRMFSGSYAPRHMGHDPRRPISVHAYGAAVDFDAPWNGYGVPLDRAQINREVVRVFDEAGWHWGGRWSGSYADAMHFQWTDPLEDVTVADWQDALGKLPAAPIIPVAQKRSLYSQNRSPDGALLDSWTSVLVDPEGRVLLGTDGKPRTYLMTAQQAARRGLK